MGLMKLFIIHNPFPYNLHMHNFIQIQLHLKFEWNKNSPFPSYIHKSLSLSIIYIYMIWHMIWHMFMKMMQLDLPEKMTDFFLVMHLVLFKSFCPFKPCSLKLAFICLHFLNLFTFRNPIKNQCIEPSPALLLFFQ